MHPARFVTWCCLYCGGVFLMTQAFFYQSQWEVGVLWNSIAGLCILGTGLYRLYSETGETYPTEYGIVTYGMVFLSIVATGMFLAGFFVYGG